MTISCCNIISFLTADRFLYPLCACAHRPINRLEIYFQAFTAHPCAHRQERYEQNFFLNTKQNAAFF